MKKVIFLSRVDTEKCPGCKRCGSVCLTEAIRVDERIAGVDNMRCVACNKCRDACPEEAIRMVRRPEPVILTTSSEDVDQTALKDLCNNAHFYPDQPVCPCNGTQVKEIAAAILKGAESLDQVILATGAASGCGIYCMTAILRLLHAAGVNFTPPKGQQWYDVTSSLWNIPDEIVGRHPGYYLEEDKKYLF